MAQERTRDATRRHDIFKFAVAMILVVIIVILLLSTDAIHSLFQPPATVVVSEIEATPLPDLGSLPTATLVPTPEVRPPTLDLPAGDISAGKVTLSGTGMPGSKTQVVVDGEIVVTTVADQSGDWSLTTAIDKPGQHEVQVQTVDEKGQVLGESEPATVNVVAAFVQPVLDLPELGDFTLDNTGQAVGRLALSGTGEPGTIVHIRVGNQILASKPVSADGAWAFDEQVTLSPGSNDLVVEMSDSNGNVLATSETRTIEVQGKPAIATPTLILKADESGLTLSGTGTPGSQVEIVANGEVLDSVVVGENGRWSYGANLEPGEYELYARAIDAQGHPVAESDTLSYTQPLPEIMAPLLTSPLEGAEISSGLVILSGVGRLGTRVEIVDNGAFVGTAAVREDSTWTFEYEIAAGKHALAVQTAQDLASLSPAVNVTVIRAVAQDSDQGDTQQAGTEKAGASEPDVGGAPSTTCSADPPRGQDLGDRYVVARCEYINLIARRVGVSPEALLAVNPQVANPNLILPGQILNLPPRD